MKYIITILVYLAASANAQSLFDLSNSGPGGFSVWHNDHWDHLGIHVDPPQSVPEPHNPIIVLGVASMALLMRRNRSRN